MARNDVFYTRNLLGWRAVAPLDPNRPIEYYGMEYSMVKSRGKRTIKSRGQVSSFPLFLCSLARASVQSSSEAPFHVLLTDAPCFRYR